MIALPRLVIVSLIMVLLVFLFLVLFGKKEHSGQ